MALTNINFYIIVLFIFIAVPVGLGIVGQSLLLDTDYVLTDRSVSYIADYILAVDQNDLNMATVNTNADLKEQAIILGDNQSSEDVKDNFMAPLNFQRIKVGETVNYFKIIYNAPTFFLVTLGIDELADFVWLVNLTTVILFIGILLMILREVK